MAVWVEVGKREPHMKTAYVGCSLCSFALDIYKPSLLCNPQFPESGDFAQHGGLICVLDIDREHARRLDDAHAGAIPAREPDDFDR